METSKTVARISQPKQSIIEVAPTKMVKGQVKYTCPQNIREAA